MIYKISTEMYLQAVSQSTSTLGNWAQYKGKRDLVQRQKRPSTKAKETFYKISTEQCFIKSLQGVVTYTIIYKITTERVVIFKNRTR